MKRILCYGDSNTWGFDASTFTPGDPNYNRYPEGVRWTSLLGQLLGENHLIIEEGLCGRTTVWDDPIEGHKNGKKYLYPCLDSQSPIDLVIIMLGTNDMKKRFSLGPFDIAAGVGELVRIIKSSGCGINGSTPEILILSPCSVGVNIKQSPFGDMFDLDLCIEKANQLAYYYEQVAKQQNCYFMNVSQIVIPSLIDAIHFEPNEHKKLAEALVKKIINEIFK